MDNRRSGRSRCLAVVLLSLVALIASAQAQDEVEKIRNASEAFVARDYQKACRILEEVIRADEDLPVHVHLRLATYYDAAGAEREAMAVYARFPENISYANAARCFRYYYADHKDQVATAVYTRWTRAHPTDTTLTLYVKGLRLVRSGRYAEAFPTFQVLSALTKTPNYILAFLKEVSTSSAADTMGEIFRQMFFATREPWLRECGMRAFLKSGAPRSAMLFQLEVFDSTLTVAGLRTAYEIASAGNFLDFLGERIEKRLADSIPEPVKAKYREILVPVLVSKGDFSSALAQAVLVRPSFDREVFGDLYRRSVVEPLYQHAVALRRAGNPGDAMPIFEYLSDEGFMRTDLFYELAKFHFVKGEYKRSREEAMAVVKIYQDSIARSPLQADAYLRTGLCYLIMADLANADGEFQKHRNRASLLQQQEAGLRLQELIDEGVNKPDAEFLFQKYYPAIQKSFTLNGELGVDPPHESTKVNPDAERAVVIVTSQIPNLRFDSNRRIDRMDNLGSGIWQLWLPAGTSILKIFADGYEQVELPAMNYTRHRAYEMRVREVRQPRTAVDTLKR